MQTINREDIVKLLRTKQGDRSLREFGKEVDCTAAHICDIYMGKRNPGPKVLGFLGLSAKKETTIIYSKKRASR